jgi:hypothetical protein
MNIVLKKYREEKKPQEQRLIDELAFFVIADNGLGSFL